MQHTAPHPQTPAARPSDCAPAVDARIASLLDRLERLNAVGRALSGERDIARLLEAILLAAKAITHADGGTLYRMRDDRAALRFEILRTDTLGLAQGGSSGVGIDLPDLPLHLADGSPNDTLVAAYSAHHKTTVNIADAYDAAHFDFSGTRAFDARTGYRSRSFLTVPMLDHAGEVIGVLQLINATDPDSAAVRPFSAEDQRLAESLASQAAIALNNRLLMAQMEALFESFIGLINLAIDEKSPYTGGHCQRVPELTMMLAEAAHDCASGPLAAFEMSDADRYELKMAGLLHDCGKITTPVHVVDKATKLQTLFDRIALIDTRWAVLARDAEIDALRRQLALRTCTQPEAEAALARQAQAQQAALEADRLFLHQCNAGSERMADADAARIAAIAQAHTWRSPEGLPEPALSADEVENLSIRAGTLTAAERGIINYHIVATIKMLECLPWPQHLRKVPEYAGGHHERMDGRGYPRGLQREQMSWQARMMAIADIFEALTAADRPYKNGMQLSQALGILAKFRDNGHIDPDLYEVFIASGIAQRYGERFLNPEQLDLPSSP